MMADSGSTEEVAVIGNTDITSAESENNIINTVVPAFSFLCDEHKRVFKSSFAEWNFPQQAWRNVNLSWELGGVIDTRRFPSHILSFVRNENFKHVAHALRETSRPTSEV